MKKNINNLDFDDLIRNFNLKKFIKYLDKQCKYKFSISPLPWMHKKFPDVFNDLVSSSLGKNITHKKLLDGIYKNEGDFIHAAIENGTLLKNVDNNFKFERSINIGFDDNDSVFDHYYDYQIISSKINKCYYILVYHTCPALDEGVYFCKKRSKDRNSAIKFVKKEHTQLKKYYKIRGHNIVT